MLNDDSQDFLCRRCHNAVPAKPKIRSLHPEDLTGIAEMVNVYEFARFIAERSYSSNVILIDDLEALNFDAIYSKNDIVVIRNAVSSLQRYPQLLEPLKMMFRKVRKAILADDFNSCPDSISKKTFLRGCDIPIEFFGYVNALNKKVGTLALISDSDTPLQSETPESFRVIAVISAFNEEDIIIPAIEQLHKNGVDVYLIDNWSTDDTYQKAQSLLGKGLLGSEKFPQNGPSPTYDWKDLLKRKEYLCTELKADWFIHHDADELHESPWEGVRLRDAIYRVDQQGYNAIDYTLLKYYPVDNNYRSESSFADYFKYFEFAKQTVRSRAWKATNGRVVINESGGHNAVFLGRKAYPYKFLLRHYPIRSQSHGEKKVFIDRIRRMNPEERKQGWHVHYDLMASGSSMLKNPEALIEFDSDFYSDYLVERLSGIGITPTEIEYQTLKNQAAEREQCIHALSAQLASITNSKAWNMALTFRRFRVLLAPPDSRRAHMLRRLKKLMRPL